MSVRPSRSETASPKSLLARLAGQGSVYALSNMFVKGSGLLLLVLYLDPSLLSVSDYGRLGLLEATAQMGVVLFGLGLAPGLLRYTAGTLPSGTSDADRDALPATALVAALLSGGVAVAAVGLLRVPLASFLLDDPSATGLVMIAGVFIGLKVLQEVPLTFLRARERAGWYAAAIALETTLLLVGVWYALAVHKAGLTGVMVAWAAACGGSALVLVIGLSWYARAWPRLSLMAPIVRFGLPLVAAALAGVALNTADRFILKAFEDASQVALYVLAAKYGGLINMALVQSFNYAFAVIGLKALASGDFGFHRSAFRHFAVLVGWVALGLSLFAADVTQLISEEPAYLGIEPLVLPVAIGFWAYGLFFVPLNALFAAERTRAAAAAAMGAALLNVLLNLLLIPLMGAAGAAWATFLAYAALAVGTARTARSQADLRLPWKTAGGALALILALWALGLPSADWSVGMRLGVRAALVLAYVPAVFAFGLYGRDDWQRGIGWVRGRLRR